MLFRFGLDKNSVDNNALREQNIIWINISCQEISNGISLKAFESTY